MTVDEINNLELQKCEKYSDFAKDKLPMPGIKKHMAQILNREIQIVDFRVRESKHKQNSKCLQIQFVLNGEVCVVFTGSGVLLDQIQSAKEKLPFCANITKVNDYFSLS